MYVIKMIGHPTSAQDSNAFGSSNKPFKGRIQLAESCIEPKNPLPERVLTRGDKKVTRIGLAFGDPYSCEGLTRSLPVRYRVPRLFRRSALESKLSPLRNKKAGQTSSGRLCDPVRIQT